jgi:hypothetical protein
LDADLRGAGLCARAHPALHQLTLQAAGIAAPAVGAPA